MARIGKGAALVASAVTVASALAGCSAANRGGGPLASLSEPAPTPAPMPASVPAAAPRVVASRVVVPAVAVPVVAAPVVVPGPALDGAAPPVPANYGAFLGGSAGSKLSEPDRKAALAAEDGAVASGERRSWKGDNGIYGFVVPGPTSAAATAIPADGAPAECRGFTSTVFFGGRPQSGKGTACRDLDGAWHVTS